MITILPEKIRIYITTGTETERTAWAGTFAARLAPQAGGFTIETGIGGWVDAAGNLVQEPVTIVTAHNHDAEALFTGLADLAAEFLAECRQDAILFEVNGQGRIVS